MSPETDNATHMCGECGRYQYTAEPCVRCYGSKQPGQQQCGTCFSFDGRGHCRRIEGDVKAHWTGCMLHVPASGPAQRARPA